MSLQWRHNGHGNVSNHQPHDYLLSPLFRRRSKKTSKLRVIGLCAGNSPGTDYSRHKWPVTRKMFPFDDFIMVKISWHKGNTVSWWPHHLMEITIYGKVILYWFGPQVTLFASLFEGSLFATFNLPTYSCKGIQNHARESRGYSLCKLEW